MAGRMIRVTHQLTIQVARDASVRDIEDLVRALQSKWNEVAEEILAERNIARLIGHVRRQGS